MRSGKERMRREVTKGAARRLLEERRAAKVQEGSRLSKVNSAMSGCMIRSKTDLDADGNLARPRYDRGRTVRTLTAGLGRLRAVKAKGGQVLVVGGSERAASRWRGDQAMTVREGKKRASVRGLTWLTSRWHGGLFTNFDAFLTYTTPFLEVDWGNGRLEMEPEDQTREEIQKTHPQARYVITGKPRRRYERGYRGRKSRTLRKALPDAVVFRNAVESAEGVAEATHMGLPTVGFLSQEAAGPRVNAVTYGIPANTRGVEAQRLYQSRVLKARTAEEDKNDGRVAARGAARRRGETDGNQEGRT